jgi:hypothetical protein
MQLQSIVEWLDSANQVEVNLLVLRVSDSTWSRLAEAMRASGFTR